MNFKLKILILGLIGLCANNIKNPSLASNINNNNNSSNIQILDLDEQKLNCYEQIYSCSQNIITIINNNEKNQHYESKTPIDFPTIKKEIQTNINKMTTCIKKLNLPLFTHNQNFNEIQENLYEISQLLYFLNSEKSLSDKKNSLIDKLEQNIKISLKNINKLEKNLNANSINNKIEKQNQIPKKIPNNINNIVLKNCDSTEDVFKNIRMCVNSIANIIIDISKIIKNFNEDIQKNIKNYDYNLKNRIPNKIEGIKGQCLKINKYIDTYITGYNTKFKIKNTEKEEATEIKKAVEKTLSHLDIFLKENFNYQDNLNLLEKKGQELLNLTLKYDNEGMVRCLITPYFLEDKIEYEKRTLEELENFKINLKFYKSSLNHIVSCINDTYQDFLNLNKNNNFVNKDEVKTNQKDILTTIFNTFLQNLNNFIKIKNLNSNKYINKYEFKREEEIINYNEKSKNSSNQKKNDFYDTLLKIDQKEMPGINIYEYTRQTINFLKNILNDFNQNKIQLKQLEIAINVCSNFVSSLEKLEDFLNIQNLEQAPEIKLGKNEIKLNNDKIKFKENNESKNEIKLNANKININNKEENLDASIPIDIDYKNFVKLYKIRQTINMLTSICLNENVIALHKEFLQSKNLSKDDIEKAKNKINKIKYIFNLLLEACEKNFTIPNLIEFIKNISYKNYSIIEDEIAKILNSIKIYRNNYSKKELDTDFMTNLTAKLNISKQIYKSFENIKTSIEDILINFKNSNNNDFKQAKDYLKKNFKAAKTIIDSSNLIIKKYKEFKKNFKKNKKNNDFDTNFENFKNLISTIAENKDVLVKNFIKCTEFFNCSFIIDSPFVNENDSNNHKIFIPTNFNELSPEEIFPINNNYKIIPDKVSLVIALTHIINKKSKINPKINLGRVIKFFSTNNADIEFVKEEIKKQNLLEAEKLFKDLVSFLEAINLDYENFYNFIPKFLINDK